MLLSLIFYGFLLLTLVFIPAGLIIALLLVLERRHQLWRALVPITHIIDRRWRQRTFMRDLDTRFPRSATFAGRRLDPQHPWGFPWTLAGIGMLAGLWFFLALLEDLITKDPLVLVDIRLHNLVAPFRTAAWTQIMLSLTEFGSPVVLTLLCVAIALCAMASHRPRLAATALLGLGLAGLLSVGLKSLFSHARPLDGIVTAHEASFPSGHMLGSAVVYGLVIAILLASGLRRGLRALGVVALLLLIVGVGLSRLYLGVHWPSDLLGSLALALMLLAALLFFLHFRGRIAWLDTYRLPAHRAAGVRAAGVALVLVAMVAAGLIASKTKLLAASPIPAGHLVNLQSLQMALPTGLPRWSEDLVGGNRRAVSLLLVGNQADVAAVFKRAGWLPSEPPTPARLLQAAMTAVKNQTEPTWPVTPAFYADKPQDLSFEKPSTGAPGSSQRQTVRLWKTAYCLLPDCQPLWVATTHFDSGLAMSSQHRPTSKFDTAADEESAVIVADLMAAGARQTASVAVSAPTHSSNAAGRPLNADGRAVILVMPVK